MSLVASPGLRNAGPIPLGSPETTPGTGRTQWYNQIKSEGQNECLTVFAFGKPNRDQDHGTIDLNKKKNHLDSW